MSLSGKINNLWSWATSLHSQSSGPLCVYRLLLLCQGTCDSLHLHINRLLSPDHSPLSSPIRAREIVDVLVRWKREAKSLKWACKWNPTRRNRMCFGRKEAASPNSSFCLITSVTCWCVPQIYLCGVSVGRLLMDPSQSLRINDDYVIFPLERFEFAPRSVIWFFFVHYKENGAESCTSRHSSDGISFSTLLINCVIASMRDK